jgi:hypothetical protein
MSYKWRIAMLLAVLVISLLIEPLLGNKVPLEESSIPLLGNKVPLEGFNDSKKSEEEIKKILEKNPEVQRIIKSVK